MYIGNSQSNYMKKKVIISSTLFFLSICTLAVMYYSPNNSNHKNKEEKSTIPNDLWYQIRSYPDGFMYSKKNL